MNQQELEAWIAQNGGAQGVQYSRSTQRIPNPAKKISLDDGSENPDYDPTAPPTIAVSEEKWTNPVTGAVLHVQRQPDGNFNIVEQSTPKPAAPTAQSAASQRTAREEAEIARNAALPPEQDPRSETDADRAARAAATIKEQGVAARQAQLDAEAKAERDRQAARQAQADADAKAKDADARAKAAAEANKPSITIKPVRQPDGSTKNVQVRVYPDGREEVVPSAVPGEAAPVKPSTPTQILTDPTTHEQQEVIRNPDGTIKELRPLPSSKPTGPATKAPSLPQIIVGQSQDALREAYDGIQAEVDAGRRTPAWGENRRKEVFETAQLAVNEANLHEQSRQFNQSQAFNVANARMGNQQGVLEFAVRTALSINGRIKKGSSAGAEMFRNLFMLGMEMQQASGINNIKPGGGQSSVGNLPGQQGRAGAPGQANRAGNPTTRPPMDPGDTKAHAASADQAAANIAAGLESNGQPRERTPATATTGGGPPLPMPATTGQPAIPPHVFDVGASPAPAPAPPPTGVPAGPPPVAGQIRIRRTAVGPGGGTVGYETNQSQADLDRMTPEERARWEIVTPAAPAAGTTDPGFNRPDMQGSTPTDPGFYPPGMQGPDTTDPGFNRPLPPQAMTPPPFAAMEQFRMPQVDPMAPPVDPMQGAGMPAALRHADVLNTPPWRLDPSMLPDLVNQFGEDVVMNWPGRELLGVG